MKKSRKETNAGAVPETPALDDKKARRALLKKQKKEKRERKKEYREYLQKRNEVPERSRPVVCPPDRASLTRGKVILGYICRIAVIFLTVFGISLFLTDAFGLSGEFPAPVRPGFIFLWSLVFTALFSVAAVAAPRLPFAAGGILAAAGLYLTVLPFDRLADIPYSIYSAVCAAFNASLDHMAQVGYYAITKNRIDFQLVGSEEEAIRAGIVLVILVISAVYSFSLAGRITVPKLIPAVIVSAGIPALVFIYNISRSNWGVSVTVSAFCGVLVLAAYDMIFQKKVRKGESKAAGILWKDDEKKPDLARMKEEKRAARLEARAARAEKRKRKKEHVVTVDEELTDYFSASSKKKKEKRAPLTKAEKAEARKKKKEERLSKAELRREVAEFKRKKATSSRAACSLGGFAGLAVFIVAFVVMFFPSLITNKPFSTFKALDDKFEYVRTYVTALLMGDDPMLDILTFENDAGNFADRTTEPYPRYFKGTPVFSVGSNSRYNIYLRGWIGTDYDSGTGMWSSATPGSDLLTEYRRLFGTTIDPSETLTYNFYELFDPGSIPGPDELDYLKRTKSSTSRGYVVSMVSVKSLDSKSRSKMLFMPSYHVRSFNVTGKLSSGKETMVLRTFGTNDPSKISYSDWFDGIYSSYRASLPNDGYSVISILPTMKNSAFYRYVADRIADMNTARRDIGRVILVEEEGCGLYTGGPNVPQFYYSSQIDEDGTEYTLVRIPQDVGIAEYHLLGDGSVAKKTVVEIPEDKQYDEDNQLIFYTAPELPLAVRYHLAGDDFRRRFDSYLRILDYYTDFVYDTYTQKSGSVYISELAGKIVSEATVKSSEEYDYVDPETGEVYTLSRSIDVPADFSGADLHPVYDGTNSDGTPAPVTDSLPDDTKVYRKRHELVMEIINYLDDEEHFTYTLTPEGMPDSTLVGVDKFVAGNHQGYCVQYATTAVLVLRELGIPARYVEGYIASGLVPGDRNGTSTYVTTVRDRNAHAWIEVWYDGIGWIQYEATPAYYSGMYEVPASSTHSGTLNPGTDESGDDETDDTEDLTPEELARLAEELRKEELRRLIKKIVTIVLISLAGAAVIFLILAVFYTRAKKNDKKRRSLMKKLADSASGGEAPTREDVRGASDLVFRLLSVCGLSPEAGEFTPEYASRISEKCAPALSAGSSGEDKKLKKRYTAPMSGKSVRRMFESIAAEEFGFGADAGDLPLVAEFWDRMYDFEYRRHVNPLKRLWLWLFAAEL